jgi:hypothetical protein
MISAEVIKGVKEVLGEHGIHQQVDERFGDFVARGIGISARQADVFLASLHDAGTVEEALLAAEIDPSTVSSELLFKVARSIGVALGRIASAL